MLRRLIAIVLVCAVAMCIALIWHARVNTSSTESITRMTALGLLLLDEDEGVSVLAVKDKSPADKAGIRPGDVLLQADGVSFVDILQLETMLQNKQKQMQLLLRRDQEKLLTVELSLQ